MLYGITVEKTVKALLQPAICLLYTSDAADEL